MKYVMATTSKTKPSWVNKRFIERCLGKIAIDHKLGHTSLSHGWIQSFESKEGKICRVIGYDFPINDCVAYASAKDKAATSLLLDQANIPHVENNLYLSPVISPKYCDQTKGSYDRVREQLVNSKNGLVLKPKDGTSGSETFHVTNPFELEVAWNKLISTHRDLVVCEFYNIRSEYRSIVLDGEVRLCYEKIRPEVVGDGKSTMRDLYYEYCASNPTFRGGMGSTGKLFGGRKGTDIPKHGEVVVLEWQHNLCKGAKAQKLKTDDVTRIRLEKIAVDVMKAMNLKFASVDIVRLDDEGKDLRVLEVNAGVMMENYSKQHPEDQEVCEKIYEDAMLKCLGLEPPLIETKGVTSPTKKNKYSPSSVVVAPPLVKRVSSNQFASGSNQNSGNFITDRPTTRVHAPPGGRSQITFG